MPICIRANKPIRYRGPLPAIKARISVRPRRAAASTPSGFEEVRGVHVYSYPDHTLVSDGIYTTDRYAARLKRAGAIWTGEGWKLPAGADVRAIVAPERPSWTCCAKAKVLSHKHQHYSCPEHTMYYEECMGADGQPIKILYACSTRGGGCYTGN